MKLEIIKQEKNPFLQREEIIMNITSESSPSESEVISKLGKDEALTVVKKINTNFGRQTFLTEVVVYDNLEAREKIETIPQKVRKKMEAEKKAAEEAAKKKAAEEAEAAKKAEEEAKEAEEAAKVEAEKPAEEKTEETKEEEKKE
jgi:ribosomal protein S24E